MVESKNKFRQIIMRTDFPVDRFGHMVSEETLREVAHEKGWKVEEIDEGGRLNFQVVSSKPVKILDF